MIELDNEGCRGRVGHDTSIVYIDEYIREYLQVEFNFVRLIELSPNRRFKTEPNTAAADIARAARGHSTPLPRHTRTQREVDACVSLLGLTVELVIYHVLTKAREGFVIITTTPTICFMVEYLLTMGV